MARREDVTTRFARAGRSKVDAFGVNFLLAFAFVGNEPSAIGSENGLCKLLDEPEAACVLGRDDVESPLLGRRRRRTRGGNGASTGTTTILRRARRAGARA